MHAARRADGLLGVPFEHNVSALAGVPQQVIQDLIQVAMPFGLERGFVREQLETDMYSQLPA